MADFQKHLANFEEIDVGIIAASVDEKGVTAKTVSRNTLAFPVGCEVDLQQVARLTGCYYDADKDFLHATGFIIDPKGRVSLAAYSTGPIGRLTAGDCLKLIRHHLRQAAQD